MEGLIFLLFGTLIYVLIILANKIQKNQNLREKIVERENYFESELNKQNLFLEKCCEVWEEEKEFLIREYEAEIVKLKGNNKFLGEQNINLSINTLLCQDIKENQKDILKHSEVFKKERLKANYQRFIILLQTSK